MADVNISKYRASVVRDGSKPASPGFVVSEGQDPVNPPGTNNYVPYTGATANVELGEYGLETGFVTLDTTPTNIPVDQGAIYWDDTRSTAALIMNGTLQHIGQDSFFYVKNSSGSTIPKGTCVGFAGTDGGSGHLLVTPFLANGSVPSTYFMGVTSEEIANGAFGQVMHFGELTGINTSGFTAGALLYASTTVAGGFQTTVPVAPNNIVLVAAAVNSKNNGAIVVRPTLGSNINSDEGVKITSPTTGDLLQLQAGGLWENKTLAQVIGSAYVPSTRTITINGTTQDLSANRTFNVGTVTSVGLSSATSGVTIGGSPVTGVGAFTLTIATASGSQNGLLSSTDWTTFNNKIGGTIATGQVAFGTAANTIGGDNGLFWDNTNKRLGIGSIIPISRIHISGNSAENTQYSAERVASAIGSSTQLLSLTAIGQIPTLTSSSANIRIIGDATWSSTSSPSRVQFETTSVGSTTVTERWRITSTGILQSNGAQTIQTSTGNLTLATAGGNGNVLLSPNGTGNVGVGITPSIWSSVNKAIQIGLGGAISSRTAVNNVQISSNYFRSASLVNTYINTDFASLYEQSSGGHFFYIAPSGTAGNAISFTQAMTLNASGNLLIGTTTDNGARFQVNGRVNATGGGSNGVLVSSNSSSVTIPTTGLSLNTGFNVGYLQNFNGGNYVDLYYGASKHIFDGGRVGIGTSNPNVALHISGINEASGFDITNTTASTGKTFRFASQAAGNLVFEDITAGAERMRITSSGNVLIGTTTDSGARLYLTGGLVSTMLSLRSNNGLSTNINFTSESPGGGSDNYTINHTIVHGSGGGYRIEHNVTSRWIRMISGTGGVELAGAATSWASISDIRQKDVLQKGIPNALEKIKGLDAIFYKYKNEEISQTSNQTVVTNDLIKIKQRRIGLIAQQVYESLPEAVKYNENEDVYRLSYTEIIPLIIEAIKELNEKIK